MNDRPSVDNSPWATWPTNHPVGMIAILAGIAAIAIFCVTQIRSSASFEDLFPQHQPSARAMARLSSSFHATDNLLLVASVSSAEKTPQLVDFAQRFVEAVRADPALAKMVRGIEYQPNAEARQWIEQVVTPSSLWYLTEQQLATLQERFTPAGIEAELELAESRLLAGGMSGPAMKLFLQDPLRISSLLLPRVQPSTMQRLGDAGPYFSDDSLSLLIEVRGTKAANDMDFVAAFAPAIRDVVDKINDQQLQVDYAGAYAIAAVAQREIRRDMIASVIGAIVLLHILFLLTYRNLLSVPLVFLPVVLGILIAFAFAALIRMPLTPPTAVLGAILAGLGVDYAIHYLSHAMADRTTGAAIARVSQSIGPALGMACVTSILAFGVLIFADVRALRHFGTIGMIGLAATLLATLSFLPAALRLMPTGKNSHAKPQVRWNLLGWMDRIYRHRNASLIVLLMLWGVMGIAAAATFRPGNAMETDLHAMHPANNAPLRMQEQIAARFQSAPDPLLLHLQAKDEQSLLQLAHEARRRMESQSLELVLSGTYGLAHLLPDPAVQAKVQTASSQFHAATFRSDFQAAVATSVFEEDAFDSYIQFIVEMMESSKPPTISRLREYPSLADRFLPTEASDGTFESLTYLLLREPLVDREQRNAAITSLRDSLDELEGATITGLSVIGADSERAIFGEVSQLFALATVLVFVWLSICYRSLRCALLAAIPAMFGVTAIAAMIGTFGMAFNMINLIAIPLIVGIGVDDGVFLVSIHRRMRGCSLEEILRAMAGSCHAIVMTSLTTALAFGSLGFTTTPAIQSLGLFVMVGIAACLAASLLLVAPLLLRDAASQKEKA